MTEAPFQLFDTLDPATTAALRASIERFGVLVPITVDQHGQILDGHHRKKIADDLGVKVRVDVVTVLDDDEAREIARSLNADRRHLDVDQRREVVTALREQGHSLRAIAGAVGVSKSQVANDLDEVSTTGQVTQPAEVRGQDGKRYPARRPSVVAAKNEREAERAQQAIATAGPALPPGVIDVKRAERISREQQADQRRAEAEANPINPVTVDQVEFRHGDFRVCLEDLRGTVDAVITDPPYVAEAVELFDHLSAVASELLTPTGVLVVMTGQYHLPRYLYLLGSRMEYRWTCAYMIPGQRNRNHGSRVGTGWKPLLVFQQKDAPAPAFLLDDVFTSDGDDKTHHHWGQSESGMAGIVDRFTKPGDLVVDPFLGGGTTGIVCRDLGRRFVGCDVDAAAVASATERLA